MGRPNRTVERICERLKADNPGLAIVPGGRHLKVVYRGRLAGILPFTLRNEGLSPNLVAQFRRAGVRCDRNPV